MPTPIREAALAAIADRLTAELPGLVLERAQMQVLSMGMSDSYRVAIDEGAARIAIGGGRGDEEGFRPRRQHGAEVPHDAPAPAHAVGGLHEAQLRRAHIAERLG